MPIPLDEFEVEVLRLSSTDRARLLERLLDSFEPDFDNQELWVDEALRREAEVLSGKVALVPGAEAVARARARIS